MNIVDIPIFIKLFHKHFDTVHLWFDDDCIFSETIYVFQIRIEPQHWNMGMLLLFKYLIRFRIEM